MRSAVLCIVLTAAGCRDQQAERRSAIAARHAAVAQEAMEKGQFARGAYAAELAAQYDPLDPQYRDLSMRLALAQIAATRPSLTLDQYARAAYQAEALEVSDPGFAHVYATVRAIDAFAHGDAARAEIGVREVTKQKPDYLSAWLMLGDLLSASKRPEEALQAFEAAAKIDPTNGRAVANLGMLAAQLGNHAKAVEYLTLAVSLDDKAGTRATLGNAHVALNQVPQALQHLERAVELAPADGRYRVNLGEALLKLNQLDLARKRFEEGLSLGAEPWASRGLGGVALQRKDYAAAKAAFARVLTVSPDDASTLFLAAEAEEGLSHPAEAAQLYERFALLAQRMPGEASRLLLAKDRLARLSPAAAPK
jgi:tetratricopeptide (TPR) repeat protein